MDLLDITSKALFFIFIFPFLYIQSSNALVNSTYVDHDCTTYASYDDNILSVNSLVSDLIHHSSNSTFYSSKSGAGENTTYGYLYCTAGIESQDCHSCVQSAANYLESYCESYKGATVFYRECTLRYSDTPVYGKSDDSMYFKDYSYSYASYKQFNKTLYSTLDTVITQAANSPSSKGFATGGAKLVGTKERLYTLAQCTPDILGSACENCLRVALDQFEDYADRTYVWIFMPNCQLAHEVRNPSSKGIIPSSLSSSESSSASSLRGNYVWYIIFVIAAGAVALY